MDKLRRRVIFGRRCFWIKLLVVKLWQTQGKYNCPRKGRRADHTQGNLKNEPSSEKSSYWQSMKKRESTGSARKRKKVMTKKTSSLEIKKVNPLIRESELGKYVIDKVTYKVESVEQIEGLWGALNHPATNVMKLLVQMVEEIQPGKYPTEEVLENMGLRMVKVLGLSPEEVKIVALHNFFSNWFTSNTYLCKPFKLYANPSNVQI